MLAGDRPELNRLLWEHGPMAGVSTEQVRWHRLCRSGLAAAGFEHAREAAAALCGVQAQINSAARLALWHRLGGDSDPSVAQRIQEEVHGNGGVVRVWGQRGTLHLYDVDDWPLVCAATGARVIQLFEKRIRSLEAKDGSRTMAAHARACELLLDALRREPEHRAVKSDLEGGSDEAEVLALHSASLKLCLEGHACRTDTGDNAPIELGSRGALFPGLVWQEPAFEAAMIEIARRFFAGYGPASEIDFRNWLSASAAESKPAVEALVEGGALVEVSVGDDGSRLLVLAADAERLAEPAPPVEEWPLKLLGRFDPLILAHADKSCWVDDEHYRRVWHHTHVEAVLLLGGCIRGTWRFARRARGMTIQLQHFDSARLPTAAERALEAQAEAVAGSFGLPLVDLQRSVAGGP